MIMCTFKRIAVSDYGLYRQFHGERTIEEYAEYLAGLVCAEGEGFGGEEIFREGVEAAARGNFRKKPDLLIVREKNLPEEIYLKLFRSIWEICQAAGNPSSLLIPHTHLPAARLTGGQSLHLPLWLLKKYREQSVSLPKKDSISGVTCIGVSIHSLDEAKTAESLGASYLTAGHIFATGCKKGAPPRGIDFLEEICGNVGIPVYAIGGIHPENIHEIQKTKAAGACMMSEYMRNR